MRLPNRLYNFWMWVKFYYYDWMFAFGSWLKERACLKVGGSHDVEENETRCFVCGKDPA